MDRVQITTKKTSMTGISGISPKPHDFADYYQSYRLIPFSMTLKADTLTPISVFQKLRLDGPCFLLESVEGNEKQARHSIIGRNPLISFQIKDGNTRVIIDSEDHSSSFENNPVAAIRQLLDMFKIPGELSTSSFRCGLTGYFSYDFIRYIERIPNDNIDTIELPDCDLFAPREVIVYDHLRHEMTLVYNLMPSVDKNLEDSSSLYTQAVESLKEIKKQLVSGSAARPAGCDDNISISGFHSNMSREEYMTIVDRAKEYIRAGDIFQAVLSQRFSSSFSGDPFQVYRSLRNVSPSPYLFFLQLEQASLAGASPEMLVRLNNNLVETSPIAGTRKRGADDFEDRQLAEELLADAKEMSEHAMLTDLARNDIGRICKFGSVNVTDFANVEMYSHVMHIVSKVEGILAADKSAIDVLCSLLPAGTLSGAPKIRAMEIIDELETVKRGPYGGAAGYLSFDGSINTCITIRTALITDGQLHIQAGAGIVADSKPDAEYDECINKAAAMIAAIEQAGDFI